MKRYLKLLNFEVNRVMTLFYVLLAVVFVIQLGALILYANKYMSRIQEAKAAGMLSTQEAVSQLGHLSMLKIVNHMEYVVPIALCACFVAFYIFFIWYRDWLGKNTFIYRLLMLPMERLSIFLAKLTTILLLTFGFIAYQVVLIFVQKMVLHRLLSDAFIHDTSVSTVIFQVINPNLLFPDTLLEFLFIYGMGTTVVVVLFTLILIERSYRLRGVIMGICYGLIALFFVLSPSILNTTIFPDYFYPAELMLLIAVALSILLVVSLWYSRFLLRHKVTV